MNLTVKVAGTLLAAAFIAAPAQAAVIQLNAEDGTLGSQWTTTPRAGAIGGQVAEGTVDDTGSAPDFDAARVSYAVNFPDAGEYDVYVRWVMGDNDNMDSIFLANNFGVPPLSDAGAWALQNSLSFGKTKLADMPATDGGHASDYPVGALLWNNFSAVFEDAAVPGQSTASDEDVPTYLVAAPGEQMFQLAHREGGWQVDAIAFALISERDAVFVDSGGNLVIPEPTSLALIGLGGLALLGRRRRAGV